MILAHLSRNTHRGVVLVGKQGTFQLANGTAFVTTDLSAIKYGEAKVLLKCLPFFHAISILTDYFDSSRTFVRSRLTLAVARIVV